MQSPTNLGGKWGFPFEERMWCPCLFAAGRLVVVVLQFAQASEFWKPL